MRHLLLLPPPPPSTCCGPRFGRFVKRIFRALRRGARCAHRFGRTPRVTPSVRVPRPLRSPLDQRTSSRGVALESLASHVCALSQAVVSVIARARKAAFFFPPAALAALAPAHQRPRCAVGRRAALGTSTASPSCRGRDRTHWYCALRFASPLSLLAPVTTHNHRLITRALL